MTTVLLDPVPLAILTRIVRGLIERPGADVSAKTIFVAKCFGEEGCHYQQIDSILGELFGGGQSSPCITTWEAWGMMEPVPDKPGWHRYVP